MADVNPHLIVSKETTIATYTATGQVAIPVNNFQAMAGQDSVEVRATGAGRSLQRKELTAMKPSFSFETCMWQEYMGRLLRAAGFTATTTTPGGATLSRLHGFRALDTTLLTICMEMQHTAAYSEFLKGCVIDTLDFSFDEEGLATVAVSGLAYDYAATGRNFIDGTTVPSITATPTYFATSIHPFVVHQAVIKKGGTVAYNVTTGKLDVTAGTQYNVIKKFNLSIANNLTHIMTKWGYKTPYTIHDGGRSVAFSADISQVALDTTWQTLWLAGTTEVIEVIVTGEIIEGALPYLFTFVIPKFHVDSADMPQQTGAIDEPVQSIEGVGLEAADGYDITLSIQDKQTAYA